MKRRFIPLSLLSIVLLSSCKALVVPEFVAATQSLISKKAALSEAENQNWRFADLAKDSIPGISLTKAIDVLPVNSTPIIVAVLDSGIDLTHEDLAKVLWTNSDEIAANGIDDDHNGYIDDIHGYNFLGDAYQEQLEVTRVVAKKIGDKAYQEAAKKELDEALIKNINNRDRYIQLKASVIEADTAFKEAIGQSSYTAEDLDAFETDRIVLKGHISMLQRMFSFANSIDDVLTELDGAIAYYSDRVDYNLNVNFDGRAVVGDNPYDLQDIPYGNGNPQNQVADESHGTHVAGIIAADRTNTVGTLGVSDRVSIMSIRSVSNGDEYDKDVALGIRYAVDNGAKIINCSFGKSFSPNAQWVYDAIKYAAKKNVLIVHAAGNENTDLDLPQSSNFPTDQIDGKEYADNVITIGSITASADEHLVSDFSNVGHTRVDIFAPGSDIYSTTPNNNYEYFSGTSMAAPVVSGVAALVWSHYPTLKAAELKKILMLSGTKINAEVIDVSSEDQSLVPFSSLSKTGRIVNAYNALKLAELVVSKKFKLSKYDL